MLFDPGGRNNGRIRTMSLETIARSAVTAFRQLKEDPEFYIPDYIMGDPDSSRPDLYAAADDHARELRKAEKHLDDALNLAGVLRASFQDAGDSRAMQADTVLKIIEKLLNKAHTCIDRHDTRFMNLFMAYFDSKDGTSPEDG
jgi:thiamine pyrophosphokinase